MNNSRKSTPIAFTSNLTPAFDLEQRDLLGLIVPASFGVTTITLSNSFESAGTYTDVYDFEGTQFSITCDATTGRSIDLTDKFPAMCRFIKFTATGVSDGKTIEVVTREID